MRDPSRIRKFCNQLADLWERNVPDWRFGQLICNVFGELASKKDPFFPEEEEMMQFFKDYFEPKETEE